MRKYRISRMLWLAAAALLSFSCSRTAGINAEITDAPSSEIVIRQLNINRYDIVDTVKTDARGRFSCKVAVAAGDPEFFYLYHNDVKIASLLLERGERVKVVADTLGNYTVEGSAGSEELASVDRSYSEFSALVDSLSGELVRLGVSSPGADAVKKEIAAKYTGYYRQCVKYVLENSHSLTVVPVFYQTVGDSFHVFSQDTDAILFRNVCDSLETVYPDSRYVKSLRQEADRRTSQLEFRIRLQGAESIGFPEIELPDVKGEKVKLSEVDAKVILLHFWTASNAEQKMFNLDVLKDVYADYHSRGFEIYQVAVDVDKPFWARTVAAQGLDWINVCDGLGSSSPVLKLYNITRLPVSFIIADGQMTDEKITDEASLRRAIGKLLK